MKIRCDVCEKTQASVFCSADEAALCDYCDGYVHHANKLASKHLRFSLLHPSSSSSKHSPVCDICQERRAMLFCQEDRAILCRECDIPIHKANEHTKKHNRYLLTGVKLSSSCSSYSSSSSSIDNDNINQNSSSRVTTTTTSPCSSIEYMNSKNSDEIESGNSTSSISEYLETLPGWKFDDFLDPSTAYSKVVNVETHENPFCWWV
ncbi:B-box zinc finger family protein [Euphorbia peplus]|nr:B-box zinc finger family protein [Euphorbia peplus]